MVADTHLNYRPTSQTRGLLELSLCMHDNCPFYNAFTLPPRYVPSALFFVVTHNWETEGRRLMPQIFWVIEVLPIGGCNPCTNYTIPAGGVFGVAKNVSLHSVRILDCSSNTRASIIKQVRSRIECSRARSST